MSTDSSDGDVTITRGRQGGRLVLVACVVMLGAFMVILDVTIVAVAQNAFQRDLEATTATAAWTIVGYTLALTAVIPLSTWTAARFGMKRTYLMSMTLFVIGSLLCGIAWDITSLILFRVVQGLGGGLITPVGIMILTRTAGPGRVASAMGLLGVPSLLGPIAGPILGGVLIEQLSWNWIFLINLPIGAATIIGGWILLPRDSAMERIPLDWVGLLLMSPGLALFLYGVSSSAEHGSLAAPEACVPAVLGAALVGAFVIHALRARSRPPLLDLRLFRGRAVVAASISLALLMIAIVGVSILYPQYLIGVRGVSTETAGLLLLPLGLGAGIVMLISGPITDRFGPRWPVLGGIALSLAGVGFFVGVTPQTPYWAICIALFVQGCGQGLAMMPMMASALAPLRPRQIPDGSTLINVVQQAASAIGASVIAIVLSTQLSLSPGAELAILSNTAPDQLPDDVAMPLPASFFADAASAFGSVFVLAAAVVAVTAIPALFLPRRPIVPVSDGAGRAER